MALCDVVCALGMETGKPLAVQAEADKVWSDVIRLCSRLGVELQEERRPRTTRWYRKARRLEREREMRLSKYNEEVKASEAQVRGALEGIGKVLEFQRKKARKA